MSLLLPPHLTSLVPQTTASPGVGTNGRIFRSVLPAGMTIQPASGTAYWVYVGRLLEHTTPQFIEMYVTVAGAGAQTAEVALASTPEPPNKSLQTLTKIVATGSLDSLAGTLVKSNSAALSTEIPAGTQLWAGIRVVMATTQPTLVALSQDWRQGNVLMTAAAGALTSGTSWTGTLLSPSVNAEAPDLRVTLD